MIARCGERVDHVQAIGTDFERGRRGPCPQRLHQMRSDLGRLDAIAEILQVGPFLGHERLRLASRSARWYMTGKMQGAFHEGFRAWRRSFALLAGPAYAQMPHINLMPDQPYQDAGGEGRRRPRSRQGLQGFLEENTGRQGLRAIPGALCAAPTTPKTPAPAKPKTKTGSTQTRTETR